MAKPITSFLLKRLENEIQRLSSNNSLLSNTEDAFDQILEKIHSVFSEVSKEKGNYEINSKFTKNYPIVNNNLMDEILQAKNKLKSTQNELLKYEKFLMEKDQILQTKENEIKYALQALNQDKQKFEDDNNKLAENIKLQEILARQFNEKNCKFNEEYEKFLCDKKLLENQQENLSLLRLQIESNFNKSNKVTRLNTMNNENLEQAMSKYDNLNRNLIKENEELLQKKIAVESMKEDVDRKLLIIDEEKKKLKIEIEQFKATKNASSQGNVIMKTRIECSPFYKDETISKNIESTDPKELEKLINRLLAQLQVFNEEVAIKESQLTEKQQKLKLDQEKIAKSFHEIEKINRSLVISKNEIHIFYTETLPAIEFIHQKLLAMMSDVNSKLLKIDKLHSRINRDVYLFTTASESNPVKNLQENIDFTFANQDRDGLSKNSDVKVSNTVRNGSEKMTLPKEQKYSELKTESDSGYLCDSRTVEEIVKELSLKIKSAEEREKKLLKESLKIAKISEIIEKAKTQFKIEKMEIERDKENNKMLKFNLEAKIKEFDAKDNELKCFKQELDKRANLLKIKENQIEIRTMQLRNA